MLKHIVKDLGLTKDMIIPTLIVVPVVWALLYFAVSVLN